MYFAGRVLTANFKLYLMHALMACYCAATKCQTNPVAPTLVIVFVKIARRVCQNCQMYLSKLLLPLLLLLCRHQMSNKSCCSSELEDPLKLEFEPKSAKVSLCSRVPSEG